MWRLGFLQYYLLVSSLLGSTGSKALTTNATRASKAAWPQFHSWVDKETPPEVAIVSIGWVDATATIKARTKIIFAILRLSKICWRWCWEEESSSVVYSAHSTNFKFSRAILNFKLFLKSREIKGQHYIIRVFHDIFVIFINWQNSYFLNFPALFWN